MWRKWDPRTTIPINLLGMDSSSPCIDHRSSKFTPTLRSIWQQHLLRIEMDLNAESEAAGRGDGYNTSSLRQYPQHVQSNHILIYPRTQLSDVGKLQLSNHPLAWSFQLPVSSSRPIQECVRYSTGFWATGTRAQRCRPEESVRPSIVIFSRRLKLGRVSD